MQVIFPEEIKENVVYYNKKITSSSISLGGSRSRRR
jgi:hypothetical protein